MTAALKRETFSPVDAAWLRMDRPTNTMMITGVMMFDRPLDVARVKETVASRMLRYDRFRQRVRETPFGVALPRWEDDPHFDINAHIHRVALPAPGDMAALQDLVSDLMSTPLDYSRPLWHFHIVENFGEGSAIIGRLHHCIGDGLALVQVLLGMTDDVPDPAPGVPAKRKARDLLGQSVIRPVRSGVSSSRKLFGAVWHEGWETLAHPSHARDLAQQGRELAEKWAKQGVDTVAAASKLLFTLPDRKTIFRGPCGVSKRAAWSEPFPISEVKAIGASLGGTINDVLLAAISGALRRYLESQGQQTEGVEIRAMVPVSLRQPHEMGKLGNRFGLIILTLPVGTVDPVERLAIMKKRMDEIKSSPEALVAFGILNTIGITPIEAEHIIVDIFASKVSAIMTNVPGPKDSLYLAGSRLTNLMFWVPAASSLGMGISILSYAGSVMVGIMTDACLVSDPITIAENFNVELRDMRDRFVAVV
ncbi:MAG: wax ester/triacylglycerol synthase family O-acyltransferase [Anaerolineae bacterium]|jgi:WS/DGAT/MGAT family acyltransferase|nr:wax ester/triacylglycerol synthase family O-acyltransferase [Anaerolineae bacterium]